ncbi:hypothetical protein [Streptomyces sp. NPDC047869]|uniref:hypothetical protein n=1 Tax=Streptomyces sp. NPDC047869 TaxID=3154709 RepID=UPI00345581D3
MDAVSGVRRSWPGRLLAVVGLAAIAGMLFPALPAYAGSTHVPCSVQALVKAISAANASPGADTLRLERKCTYRLLTPNNAGNGLPTITSRITIDGNGATITRARSAPDFRILHVGVAGDLTLNKTTISGGVATDCPGAPSPPFPPGIVCGGGIDNQGVLTVNHSRVINNAASSAVYVEGGGIDSDGPSATLNDTEVSGNTVQYTGTEVSVAAGGGIANDGPVTINRSRVHHNTTSVRANTGSFATGAIAVFAQLTIKGSTISDNRSSAPGGTARGAVNNSATVTVTDTIFRNNTADAPHGTANGGAVANGGTMSLTDSLITGNTATAKDGTVTGGGISVSPVGDLTLSRTTVRDNAATASGGTARGGGISNLLGGTVRTDQSGITKNSASAPGGGTAQGGGIFNAIGSTTLNKSTVTDNRAGDGGGIFKASGTVTLNDTLVKRNHPNNCAPPGSVPGCTN